MSVILMAGKHCIMCSESRFAIIRREHIRDFSSACDKAIEDIGIKLAEGEAEYDDVLMMEDLVAEVRLICLRCDGKQARAFLIIEAKVAVPTEEDIKAAKIDQMMTQTKAMEDKGVEKEGNVYKVAFKKR